MVLRRALCLASCAAVSFSSSAFADRERLWVFLTDKGVQGAELTAAIAELERTSDPRTVERRRLRRSEAGLFDERDLPVAAAYAERVESLGVRIKHRSRWLNAVSVESVDAATLAAVRALPFVAGVEPVRSGRGTLPEETTIVAPSGEFSAREFYGASRAQLDQIGVPQVHSAGGTGAGVVVGVLDTGFVTTHRAFHEPGHEIRIRASYDFLNNDANVGIEAGDHPDQHRHGTWILGCIASYWPNVLVGGAYDAEFVLAKTEDYANEVISEEDNYVAGLEFVESHGADVCTSSLGYIDWYQPWQLDGRTAITTRAVNIATENGLICVTAAGNNGHDADPATNHLLAPADAFRVISCGAADIGGTIAGFSSDGPSADGRVKPEVLACGVDTRTISSRNDTDLGQVSGTSLSTPLVAAAVASLVSKMPCVTVDQIRSFIIGTSARSAPDPQFVLGYGLMNAGAALARGTCPADFNRDGFVDGFDYDGFVSCFEGEACPACASPDIDSDGFVDGFDYDNFVAMFEAGC